MRSSQSGTIELLLLTAITAAVYAGSFHGVFQFDDVSTILDNPHLDGWLPFFAQLTHMVRPVLRATFLLDRWLYGDHAGGYHLLNVVLHLGSGCLVYRLLRRAVTEEFRSVPCITALLFLVHPIQTETVTYISGRATGLMAFLFLLTLTFYDHAEARRDASDSYWPYFVGALVSFGFALGSKETAMMLPLTLLLWDLLGRRLNSATRHGIWRAKHLSSWLVLGAAGVWAWWHPRYAMLADYSFHLRPLREHLLSQLHAAAYAIALVFSPWKQNFDHDLPVPHSLSEWPVPIDLVVLGGLATGGVLAVRRLPLFSFGIGWFFLQLLPTTVIPRNDVLSERNLYLASVGLFLAIAVLAVWIVQWLDTRLRRGAVVRWAGYTLAACVTAVLCLFTVQRNALYHDPVLLWSDAVKKSPLKARPHNNLGHSLAVHGSWDQAIEEFRTAARLDPDYAVASSNLRDAYLHRVGRR